MSTPVTKKPTKTEVTLQSEAHELIAVLLEDPEMIAECRRMLGELLAGRTPIDLNSEMPPHLQAIVASAVSTIGGRTNLANINALIAKDPERFREKLKEALNSPLAQQIVRVFRSPKLAIENPGDRRIVWPKKPESTTT